MYKLQNEKLAIEVLKTGAELCKITSVKHNTAFMWNANPDIWGSYAPNLFPIIGALKDSTYYFENISYQLPKHGLVRHNDAVVLDSKTENQLIFKLTSSENSLKLYPFEFEFYIIYTLTDNTIKVTYKVENLDNKDMYFSVGGHPAFKCPIFDDESYNDYFLEFDRPENAKRYMMNMENGLMTSKTKPVFKDSNILTLDNKLFSEDALVFKDIASKTITLKSKKNGEILSFTFDGFPYLGIWAKPNGDFVCIEPWYGIADHENTNQQLIDKEGILKLKPNKSFEASYHITIHNEHLV